jgi:hypothetical protein
MPSPSAHIHEVICAGLAPNACAAWNTMATELVKAHQHGDKTSGGRGQAHVFEQMPRVGSEVVVVGEAGTACADTSATLAVAVGT